MEVTYIGWLLIPLGIGLYFFAPRWLYPVTVFSIFFSATAVVNVGSPGSYSGVQATMYFGALWTATEITRLRRFRRLNSQSEIEKPMRRLLLFFAAVVLSLIMPLWINRGIVIESPEFSSPDSTVLLFTFRHVTQMVYIAYGILLTIFVAFKNSSLQEFRRSVRFLTLSALFISGWGFLQFCCNVMGVEYPAYIFNTSKAESALGYLQELADLGVQRVSSVTTEPSVFGQCLLISLLFVVFALVSSQPIISKGWDRLALLIIVGGMLISTSTTAYAGLAFAALLCIPVFLYMRLLRPRHALYMALFAVGLGVTYLKSAWLQDFVDSLVIGKGQSYSGMARLLSVLMARDYFLQYPILGLGWGSVTSDDLIFKLLSNTGVIGLLTFVIFVVSVLTHLWRTVKFSRASINPRLSLLPVSMLVVFVVMLFTSATSGFVYAYSHVWFVFGMAMAVPAFCPSFTAAKPVGVPGKAITA